MVERGVGIAHPDGGGGVRQGSGHSVALSLGK